MNSYYAVPMTSDYIYHHGIIGQKWGVRRFQNSDGSLTPAGKARYSQNEKIVGTKYGITNGAFSKEKYLKSIDDLNNQIESLEIKKEDKNSLRQIFNTERIDREYKRDAHYGTLDDQELLELLTMEHEAFNEECERIINKYNSEKVNNIIDRIKSFDTYTDGHFSDYKKGNEYMFEDDFVKIYENGIKGRELKHHGIIGQKWGIRRYQNPDGSLTDAGKKRYNRNYSKDQAKKALNYYKDQKNKYDKTVYKEIQKNQDIIDRAEINAVKEIDEKFLYKPGHEKELLKIYDKYMDSKKVINAQTRIDQLSEKSSELNSAIYSIERYIKNYSNKKLGSFYIDIDEKHIEEYLRNK